MCLRILFLYIQIIQGHCLGFEGVSCLRVTFKNGFNTNSSFSDYDVCVMDFVSSHFCRVTQCSQLCHLLVKAEIPKLGSRCPSISVIFSSCPRLSSR